jgi:uncharacterized peroxidase-related enzyme
MLPIYLTEVETTAKSGSAAGQFRAMEAQGIPVPQILYLFAYKPRMTEHLSRFTQELMRGPSALTPGQRELIAAFTSSRNQCPFWIGSHAAVAAELLGSRELVQSVLKNYTTAPISDAEKALFKFVAKVNRTSSQITAADIEEARGAGWSDEALYDAISVCALFNFYNRWIDATGVQDMSTLGYQMSGHRLATEGYAHEEKR